MVANATFHSFERSGKWYATGRGHLPDGTFRVFETSHRRAAIVEANDGKYPGLSGPGNEFVFVVIPDDDHPTGYPLMLHPKGADLCILES